jgi:hypothetical protein
MSKLNIQKWLDRNYPKETRTTITKLRISNKQLIGKLDLSDFPKLTELNCSQNEISEINIENNPDLTVLLCHRNKLTSVNTDNNPELTEFNFLDNQFTSLSLANNKKLEIVIGYKNKISADLVIFSHLTNLKKLDLGLPERTPDDLHNDFYGSLKSLENCGNLEWLCIGQNKRITEGLEYLPDSLIVVDEDSKNHFGCHGTVFENTFKNFDCSLGKKGFKELKEKLIDYPIPPYSVFSDKKGEILLTKLSFLKREKEKLEEKLFVLQEENEEISIELRNLISISEVVDKKFENGEEVNTKDLFRNYANLKIEKLQFDHLIKTGDDLINKKELEISEKTQQVENLTNQIDSQQSQIKELEEEIINLSNEITELNKQFNILKEEKANLIRECDKLVEQNKNLPSSIKEEILSDINSVLPQKQRGKNLNSVINSLLERNNQITSENKELKIEKKTIEKDIERWLDTLNVLVNKKNTFYQHQKNVDKALGNLQTDVDKHVPTARDNFISTITYVPNSIAS